MMPVSTHLHFAISLALTQLAIGHRRCPLSLGGSAAGGHTTAGVYLPQSRITLWQECPLWPRPDIDVAQLEFVVS